MADYMQEDAPPGTPAEVLTQETSPLVVVCREEASGMADYMDPPAFQKEFAALQEGLRSTRLRQLSARLGYKQAHLSLLSHYTAVLSHCHSLFSKSQVLRVLGRGGLRKS